MTNRLGWNGRPIIRLTRANPLTGSAAGDLSPTARSQSPPGSFAIRFWFFSGFCVVMASFAPGSSLFFTNGALALLTLMGSLARVVRPLQRGSNRSSVGSGPTTILPANDRASAEAGSANWPRVVTSERTCATAARRIDSFHPGASMRLRDIDQVLRFPSADIGWKGLEPPGLDSRRSLSFRSP